MSECINIRSQPKHTIGEIVRAFGARFVKVYHPTYRVMKVLSDIANCKTASLGGHYVYCTGCGYKKKVYNSCGNGNCPQCQSLKRMLWIDKTVNHLLPVRHFHVIFTLPQELKSVIFYNQRKMYGLFFHAAWETINEFNGKGKGGMVSTLHTWGSNLSYHPHLHCIVSDGSYDGKSWKKVLSHNSRFFVKSSDLREMFKKIFIRRFEKLIEEAKGLYYEGKEIDDAGYRSLEKITEKIKRIKNWSVRVEIPVKGQKQIVEYLGRYVSRVAITNSRILEVTEEKVKFSYKIYAKQKKGKAAPKGTREMKGERFLQQFTQHILPRYLHRVRYFGIYAFTNKQVRSEAYELLSGKELPEYKAPLTRSLLREALGTDPDVCPECASYQTLITIPLEGEYKPIRFSLGKYWSYPSIRLRRRLKNISN